MARVYQIGFEAGTPNEWGNGLTATVTGDAIAVDTGIVRSGTYSYKVSYSTTASTTGRAGMITLNTGTTNTLFCRFYLYITSIPNERSQLIRTWNVTTALGTRGSLSINTDGSLQLYNGATTVGSASTALTTNTWHRVEYSVICNGTNQVMSLLVDGVSVASGVSFANTNADYTLQFGWSATGTAGPTKTGTYYIDDVVFNYDAAGGQTGFPPADSKLILLLPVADSAVGTGWTLGTGTATGGNAWAALDTIPPQGVADLTAGSDTKQVRNAAAAANSNLDIAVMDYAAAGIESADTINLVAPFFYTAAPVATSAKAGTYQVLSNPVGASVSLTQFYSGVAAGTFPTGWQIVVSTSAIVEGDIAAGNRSTRPVVRLQQVTSSTRIAMACLASLYVDYTPAAVPSTSITLVGTPTTGVGSSITATSLSVTVPSGSTGDLLLFLAGASAVSATAGAPTIAASTAGLTQLQVTTGISFLHTKVFYRFVQVGDPTSYTFTINVGAPFAAVCARYSGVSSTTPFRFLNVGKLPGSATATTSQAFAALDDVHSTDLVIAAAAVGTSVFNTTQASALSTPAAGWTNVVNQLGPTNAGTSSSHVALALYSKQAAISAPTITGSTGGWAITSFALIDAAANDPTPPQGSVVTFVNAASTGGTAGATSIVVNVPSGVVDGNLLLAVMASANGLNGWSPPAGWTPLILANAWTNAGTTSNIGDCDARLFYRFASSEPANYTFTVTNSATLAGTILAYSGVRNPYPVYIDNVQQTEGSGVTATTTSPTPYDISSMNLVTPNAPVLICYVAGGDASGIISMTPPSSPWATRVNVASNRAGGFNLVVAVVEKPAATDRPTATASAASGWVVYSIALTGPPFVWAHRLGPNYRR